MEQCLKNNLGYWYMERNQAVIVDKDGILVFIHNAYSTILGSTQAELIGRPVTEVIPGTNLMEVIRQKKEKFGQKFIMANGENIVCDYQLLYDREGNLCGACTTTPYFRAGTSLPQDLSIIEQLKNKVAQLRKENELYHNQLGATVRQNAYSLDKVVGNSRPMQELKIMVSKIADTNLVVLLTGETGVGKEVIGNAIHQLSRRALFNFIKINCAAIPKELMESELFGYESGAFSGASSKGKIGKFELANNGTILLDEIGELPLDMQGKLLRVLQENEIERVGGLKPIPINVRVICSTNCDLEKMIEEGHFRQDLYYRINVVELHIPPLRERKEDIPLFCEALIEKINHYHNTFIGCVEDKAMNLLMTYDWPGNVRELEHSLERGSVLTSRGDLSESCFDILKARIMSMSNGACAAQTTNETLFSKKQLLEKEAIMNAISQAHGNKSLAAKNLGISRRLLYDKIARYQMIL